MGWTTPEVKNYILSELGHPRRKVELENTHLSDALRRSFRYYGTKKPIIRRDFINILNGVQSYDLAALNKPYGKGVIWVHPEPITSPSQVFTEFEYYRLRQPPYVDMSEIVMDRLYYDEIGNLTGTDFDWHWEQATTQILIKPIPNRSFTLGYEYNYEPTKIEDIPLTDQGWVADYALAEAKGILGLIRRKYKGVPGIELPVETDGDDLVSESREDKEALKEALWASRGDWTPPIKG